MGNRSTTRNDQREAILSSAYTQFARYGFRKATVEDIARGAGLKKPSVYYYFKSKDEIIRAMVSRESRALLTAMESAAADEKTIGDKLRAFFWARFRYFKEKKSLGTVSVDEIDEMLPLIREARQQFFELEIDLLSKILEHGIAAGETEIDNPRLCSLVAVAALQGIDDTFWRRGLEDHIEAGINLMMEIFLRGLGKER
jgi:AcrR family transcriptional regulator